MFLCQFPYEFPYEFLCGPICLYLWNGLKRSSQTPHILIGAQPDTPIKTAAYEAACQAVYEAACTAYGLLHPKALNPALDTPDIFIALEEPP